MKIFLLILYIVLILAVIFFERKRPVEALLWTLVVVCIPYVGIILYLVFGSTMAIKLTTYFRKKKLKEYYQDYNFLEQDELEDVTFSSVDEEVIKFNYKYNHAAIASYDDIDILTTGVNHYNKLFEDIKNAKESIFVEFYTVHNDEVGHAFVKALEEKAKEGIKVILMCDFIANFSVPPKMFRPLRKAGGIVIRIKPFITQYRSHRKIVVIDHAVSYIGGMNIGRKYINRDKIKNPWRDTQLRLTGDATKVLEQYFLTDFLCYAKKKKFKENLGYFRTLNLTLEKPLSNYCQFVKGGVDNNKESIKLCYLSLIRSAKKSIRIQTPYFIPDSSILDSLKTASASGIKIEIMVPLVKSSFFLDPVSTYYLGELLKCGVKVYKYAGYVHAKTMIIDDEIFCCGSVNLSIRSLIVDDEICGLFYKNELVKKYNDIFIDDLKMCTEYNLTEFNERGSLEKILESIFVLFSPLM